MKEKELKEQDNLSGKEKKQIFSAFKIAYFIDKGKQKTKIERKIETFRRNIEKRFEMYSNQWYSMFVYYKCTTCMKMKRGM